MKRSRTCQCLQELDTPKRSRSTPDLGALRRANEVLGRDNFTFVDSTRASVSSNVVGKAALESTTLRLFGRPTAVLVPPSSSSSVSSSGIGQATSSLYSGGSAVGSQAQQHQGYVVDSIVRSKGSLNEIVILEHEQFIGDESLDFGGSSGSSTGSSSADGGEAALLFEDAAAPASSVFGEDSGDSSDYFCHGLDSDEADACEEDMACNINPTVGEINFVSGSEPLTTSADEPATLINPTNGDVATASIPDQAIEAGALCSLFGHDEMKGTAEWTAPRSRCSSTTTVPSWCGQRGRAGFMSSAGRVGGVGKRAVAPGWTRSVYAGPDGSNKSGGEGRFHPPLLVPSTTMAATPSSTVYQQRCSSSGPKKRSGSGIGGGLSSTVSPPWPNTASTKNVVGTSSSLSPSATAAAFDAATAAGVITAATEGSSTYGVLGSGEDIAPFGMSASAPCPAAAGFYGGGRAAPGDRHHRHHDPGGGGVRTGTAGQDAVVALLNVNLDSLHLENSKPCSTRVV